MSTPDNSCSRARSDFAAGTAAAARLLRDIAQAKEYGARGDLGSMFASQSATDLRAAADRVEKLEASSALRSGAAREDVVSLLREADAMLHDAIEATDGRLKYMLDQVHGLVHQATDSLAQGLRIEFHQQDFIPGFAAFLPHATTPRLGSTAFCVLNLGSILATVETGDTRPKDLPYFIAECMMHEIMHAIEQWAGVDFNEERIEQLLEEYRASIAADVAASEGVR